MVDLEIHLGDEPGRLATMGETLGAAGVSVEGGGMWVVGDVGVAHVLVVDSERASAALAAAGIDVVATREVVVQRLDQDVPGQLGMFCRAVADAGVNIEVLYSDHDHRLVVAADDHGAATAVSRRWETARAEEADRDGRRTGAGEGPPAA